VASLAPIHDGFPIWVKLGGIDRRVISNAVDARVNFQHVTPVAY
jgi:hypothetical protein